ncbi:glycosyltransferase [Dyella koreensis]|uniref:Glycosyl transferase n=1 Tax=Dyella koreensis TaxID=311235 RepID=A0ABW8K7A7_9GAMM
MKKINVFLFAAHHASGNVAAQRFKGLLKYLDGSKYRVYVFARGEVAERAATDSQDIHVIALPGHCVGSESTPTASAFTLLSAFVRPLPFLFAGGAASASRPWLVNALGEAERLCRRHMAEGERCVVIGTYSPIDALIAAASLATRHRLPCLQDFRDGLVFEPLGHPGRAREFLRTLIEARVVAAATLVTSVSRALVDDFAQRYPGKRTGLLPNGYDPADFVTSAADDSEQAAAILSQQVPEGALLIGHFGRIGASDGSASKSLDAFIEQMNALDDKTGPKHVLFVGELTPGELASIRKARFGVSVIKPVRRALALQLMKRCDKLLLLTGNRVCCATGKLFEYLAAGAQVVCVSGVENEASAILAETGSGHTLLAEGVAAEALGRALSSTPTADARRDIAAYSKTHQAGVLDRWLTDMVTA